MDVLIQEICAEFTIQWASLFGIPGLLICETYITKFGTNVEWNMLFDMISKFYHNQQNSHFYVIFFSHFLNSHIKNHG